MDNVIEAQALKETSAVLAAIGRNIRQLRGAAGLTLQTLAEQTRMSPSMLSLLERGKTGPSIGTLVVIASALGAQMSDLLERNTAEDDGLLSRAADQPIFAAADGVTRRIVKNDRARGIEVAVNEYRPGTASAPLPNRHEGFEYGFALEGTLEVTIDGRTHVLREGDMIAYPSTTPHRIANAGGAPSRALWINLRREP